MPPGRENFRQQRKIGLVSGFRRQLQRVEIRAGDAQVLSLTTVLGAHKDIPVCPARETEVYNLSRGLSFPLRSCGSGRPRL